MFDLGLTILGWTYSLGFVVCFILISRKTYRALRYSSHFWRSSPADKVLSVGVACVMTVLISVGWMIAFSWWVWDTFFNRKL